MQFRTYAPIAALGKYIERLWQCSDSPRHRRERILPSGTVELVVNLREDELRIYDPVNPDHYQRLSGAIVSGAYSKPFWIDPAQHASIIGVHFRPGGAASFFGLPIAELADRHVDLESVWGPSRASPRRHTLRGRVIASCQPSARHRAVGKFFPILGTPPLAQ